MRKIITISALNPKRIHLHTCWFYFLFRTVKTRRSCFYFTLSCSVSLPSDFFSILETSDNLIKVLVGKNKFSSVNWSWIKAKYLPSPLTPQRLALMYLKTFMIFHVACKTGNWPRFPNHAMNLLLSVISNPFPTVLYILR